MNYCIEKQTLACMAWVTHCYMQVEDSLDKCSPNDQPILKNRIFDMFDRVKFLLDKKYAPNPQGYTITKGENVMRYEHEKTRRHAENTIAEANRHLDSGRIKKPKHHQMLTNMVKEATETLRNLDTMDDARPYSDTRIGYNADTRQHGRTSDETMRTAMEVVNRILPKIMDDMDDAEMRRGVPGTGRGRVRADRYDMDDDYMDDDDDLRVVNMPRWRSARTGRFLPNLYGPRRVRRVRRRADMDDDMRYDDDYMRYDARSAADESRQMANEARRAADEARRAADNARTIYPGIPPVMPRGTNDDTRDESYRTHRPGPDMTR